MMIAQMDNKKRAENLSATDRVKITDLVKRYWFIIENKKSDTTSVIQKSDTWRRE